MKLIFALFVALSVTSAQASYFATHCSNSKGDVRWETGHNTNQIFLKNGEDVVNLPFFHVQVNFLTELKIRQESIRRCGFASSTKVIAGQVVISPSAEHPESLDFLGETKKIETDVICTTHINGRAPCPEAE